MTEYSFVVDISGRKLTPTKVNKAWYLVRKQKAVLISKYPMAIQLFKEVKEVDNCEFICGIDDGSIHVGIAIVQKCKSKDKVVFKGVIEQRHDVKHLIDVRRGYRRYHRNHKRYRAARFDNRGNSKRENGIAPSIKQKKDSILRVISKLNKWINLSEYHLEDVAIDIRALQEGKKLYSFQYQKSNRLDENLRKAVILRDGCKCMECNKTNCVLEVHHITPRRDNGSNDLRNLITLCEKCHQNTWGKESKFKDKYYKLIEGKNIRFDYAQHVMQGKNYLRGELGKLGKLSITTGGDTSNRRIDLGIEKSHSNDAIVITDCNIDKNHVDIREWNIKPMRRKFSKDKKIEELNSFKHRDLVKYTKKDRSNYIGYITALYPKRKVVNITTLDGQILKRYGINRCELLWRFNKIYWF